MPHTTYGLLKAIRSHTIDVPDVGTSIATGRPNACNLCHLDQPYGWTGQKLEEWYGRSAPRLPPEHREVAASVVGILRGDAGARALWAWSLGWSPAQEASGSTDWMLLYLGELLTDPYDAVRYIAHRSLRSLPGYRASTTILWLPQRNVRKRRSGSSRVGVRFLRNGRLGRVHS